jgi:hypothetical protein
MPWFDKPGRGLLSLTCKWVLNTFELGESSLRHYSYSNWVGACFLDTNGGI